MSTSQSSGPRVKRGKAPPAYITEGTYRKHALDALFRDFEGRCAYSMQHWERAGGRSCMEIDHHNPRLRKVRPQPYSNLHLASRHCNLAKGSDWPDDEMQRTGVRFLDCCKEQDYGVHIVEDLDSGQLVGLTPAGIYHIEMLALNAPHLVKQRMERTRHRKVLHGEGVVIAKTGKEKAASAAVDVLRSEIEIGIPQIPALPKVPENCPDP